MQVLTYAKMKAATPARAATRTEPWTLEADPVNWVGVAVAAGAVALCAYEMVPVLEGLAAEVVGRTVMVE